MNDGLKFTVRYQRKIQPEPYTNMTIGLEMDFPIVEGDFRVKILRESHLENAFKVVRDQVEQWIHDSLNEERR